MAKTIDDNIRHGNHLPGTERYTKPEEIKALSKFLKKRISEADEKVEIGEDNLALPYGNSVPSYKDDLELSKVYTTISGKTSEINNLSRNLVGLDKPEDISRISDELLKLDKPNDSDLSSKKLNLEAGEEQTNLSNDRLDLVKKPITELKKDTIKISPTEKNKLSNEVSELSIPRNDLEELNNKLSKKDKLEEKPLTKLSDDSLSISDKREIELSKNKVNGPEEKQVNLSDHLEKWAKETELENLSKKSETLEVNQKIKLSEHQERVKGSEEVDLSKKVENIEKKDIKSLSEYKEVGPKIEELEKLKINPAESLENKKKIKELPESAEKIKGSKEISKLSEISETIKSKKIDSLEDGLEKLEDSKEVKKLSSDLETINKKKDIDELSKESLNIEHKEVSQLSETLDTIKDKRDITLSEQQETITDDRKTNLSEDVEKIKAKDESNLSDFSSKIEDTRNIGLSDLIDSIKTDDITELSSVKETIDPKRNVDLSDKRYNIEESEEISLSDLVDTLGDNRKIELSIEKDPLYYKEDPSLDNIREDIVNDKKIELSDKKEDLIIRDKVELSKESILINKEKDPGLSDLKDTLVGVKDNNSLGDYSEKIYKGKDLDLSNSKIDIYNNEELDLEKNEKEIPGSVNDHEGLTESSYSYYSGTSTENLDWLNLSPEDKNKLSQIKFLLEGLGDWGNKVDVYLTSLLSGTSGNYIPESKVEAYKNIFTVLPDYTSEKIEDNNEPELSEVIIKESKEKEVSLNETIYNLTGKEPELSNIIIKEPSEKEVALSDKIIKKPSEKEVALSDKVIKEPSEKEVALSDKIIKEPSEKEVALSDKVIKEPRKIELDLSKESLDLPDKVIKEQTSYDGQDSDFDWVEFDKKRREELTYTPDTTSNVKDIEKAKKTYKALDIPDKVVKEKTPYDDQDPEFDWVEFEKARKEDLTYTPDTTSNAKDIEKAKEIYKALDLPDKVVKEKTPYNDQDPEFDWVEFEKARKKDLTYTPDTTSNTKDIEKAKKTYKALNLPDKVVKEKTPYNDQDPDFDWIEFEKARKEELTYTPDTTSNKADIEKAKKTYKALDIPDSVVKKRTEYDDQDPDFDWVEFEKARKKNLTYTPDTTNNSEDIEKAKKAYKALDIPDNVEKERMPYDDQDSEFDWVEFDKKRKEELTYTPDTTSNSDDIEKAKKAYKVLNLPDKVVKEKTPYDDKDPEFDWREFDKKRKEELTYIPDTTSNSKDIEEVQNRYRLSYLLNGRIQDNKSVSLKSDSEDVPSYKAPNIVKSGLSGLLRLVAEKTLGSIGKGATKSRLITETLLLLTDARDLLEKLSESRPYRLPGNGSLGALSTVAGFASKGVSVGGVLGAVGNLLGDARKFPYNRPQLKGKKIKERTKWVAPGQIVKDNSESQDELGGKKGFLKKAWDNIKNNATGGDEDGDPKVSDGETRLWYEDMLNQNKTGDVVTQNGISEFGAKVSSNFLLTKKAAASTSFEEFKKEAPMSWRLTTPEKFTSTSRVRNYMTLDSNHVWEVLIRPYVGDLNGDTTWLPSIAEIDLENKIAFNVTTHYSTGWLPIIGYELQSKKLTSKELQLFNGNIYYPIGMEYTNELRLTFADDSLKSMRRYFELASRTSVYMSNSHNKIGYGDANSSGPVLMVSDAQEDPTVILEGRITPALYKNVSFLIDIFALTPQLATVSRTQLLCVIKDFMFEGQGEIDSSPTELSVIFSIVGEWPKDVVDDTIIDFGDTEVMIDNRIDNTPSFGESILNNLGGVLSSF